MKAGLGSAAGRDVVAMFRFTAKSPSPVVDDLRSGSWPDAPVGKTRPNAFRLEAEDRSSPLERRQFGTMPQRATSEGPTATAVARPCGRLPVRGAGGSGGR